MDSTLWFMDMAHGRSGGVDLTIPAMVKTESELLEYFGADIISRMVEGEQDGFKILDIYRLEHDESGVHEQPGALRLTEAMVAPDGWFGKINDKYFAERGGARYINPNVYYLFIDDEL